MINIEDAAFFFLPLGAVIALAVGATLAAVICLTLWALILAVYIA